MKAELIRPLLLATTKVLDRLTGGPCFVDRPMVAKTLSASTLTRDVIIRLSGSVDGAMVLRFPDPTALAAVRDFHGTDSAGTDVTEGMAEIGRTIERVVRRQASAEGIWPAGPVIRSTPANQPLPLDDTPWLTTCIRSPAGNVTFAVSVKRIARQPSAAIPAVELGNKPVRPTQ